MLLPQLSILQARFTIGFDETNLGVLILLLATVIRKLSEKKMYSILFQVLYKIIYQKCRKHWFSPNLSVTTLNESNYRKHNCFNNFMISEKYGAVNQKEKKLQKLHFLLQFFPSFYLFYFFC